MSTNGEQDHTTRLSNPLLLANPASERQSDVASSRVADDDNLLWRDLLAKNEVAVDGGSVLQGGREGIWKKAILDGCEGGRKDQRPPLGRSL